MTVRIDAGKIFRNGNGMYERLIDISDKSGIIFSRIVRAVTREELEIIDHENFMKE